MFNSIKKFIRAEEGAMTAEWVVICAAVVGLAVAMVAAIETGTVTLTGGIDAIMSGWSF